MNTQASKRRRRKSAGKPARRQQPKRPKSRRMGDMPAIVDAVDINAAWLPRIATARAAMTAAVNDKKHPGGRPRLIASPEEMAEKLDKYFAVCDARTRTEVTREGVAVEVPWPIPYTIAGMSYHLGFSSRHGMAEYAKLYPEFSATISRARLRVEAQRSEQLVSVTGSTHGMEFDLKNNFGWRDVSHVAADDGDNAAVPGMLFIPQRVKPKVDGEG